MSTTSLASRASSSSVQSTVNTSSAASSATNSRASNSSRAASSASSGSSQSQGSSTQSSAAASSAASSSSSAIPSSSSSIASSSMSSSSVTSTATSNTAAATGGSVISSSNNDGSTTVTKKGLSGGAIGGIVGGVVGVLALCVLTWLLLRWKRRRRDVERYPLPAPRPDMVFAGKPVADKEERPAIAKGRGHESFNSLYAPSLPSYYPNYNRHVGSIHQGMDTWSPPQPQYMSSTTPSSPSTPSRSLQPMSSQSSMALTNAVAASGQQSDSQDRPVPPPILTTGLAPPASVDNGASNVSRRSSRSTMMFPHVSHSPSMTSMHSNGFGNTPHGGRRITLTMPTPLDPSTAVDGYLPHSRTNSISEFGQYTTSMYGSPASTNRRTRDSRRSLQPYHQGHLSPHAASASSELASIPGAAAPISGVSLHQAQSSISTITAPSSGPSRNGSGSAGSTSGGATSDSEALMIRTAKGKQVDRTS